jgi:hypothetical protein
MNEVLLNELQELFTKKEQVLTFLKENVDFLDPFICNNKGVTKIPNFEIKSEEYEATSTSFAFYYLTNILRLNNFAKLPSTITKQLNVLIENHALNLQNTFLKDHKEQKTTQTGVLPNNYNTSIQLAGILSVALYNKDYDVDSETKNLFDELIGEYFVPQIEKNVGFIERIGSDTIPSPYLTFWALEAIILYDQLYKTSITEKIYDSVTKYAINGLSKAISYSYSGLKQSFDAIEVSYLLLILLALLKNENIDKTDSNSVYSAKKIITHVLEMLLTKYFFNGTFTKSLPVFADANNFSLSCPTVEPISLLLVKHPESLIGNLNELSNIYEWILESKFKSSPKMPWTWRSEWEHQSSKPTSFMAISVYSFVIGFEKFIDLYLSKHASEILGVQPYFHDKEQESIKYPEGLDEIVTHFIVRPIEEGKKDLAHYSTILFGPPGTSKTTISKKIAQDLKWPFLVINANSFLKSGIEKIDYEAERIFKLVSYLENVVVLFDEVEELVLSRESNAKEQIADQRSRLLTTSMLPRINDLRSSCRVVFIFATNYINHIDNAISRTGRFDCVHCVMPPNAAERKNIMFSILKKNNINSESQISKSLLNTTNIDKTERFCYADLRDLIKRIEIRSEMDDTDIETIIINEIKVGVEAAIPVEVYDEFKKKKEKLDRPKPTYNK